LSKATCSSGGLFYGRRRERRRQDDRTADRIAAALALIRKTDEHWHGLAVWLSRSGMDRDAELLDRRAARATRLERDARFRAEARASRRRDS
jgi:hypothetical protein